MRLVADSNILKDEAFRAFLSCSRANRVVVTDYLMMEAYKSGDVAQFLDLMVALCDFREQVVILKSTAAVSRLRGRSSGLIRSDLAPGT